MSPEVNQEISGFYNTPIIQQQVPNSAIIDNPFTSNNTNQQKIKPSKKKKKDDISVESQQKLNLVEKLFSQMS